MHMDKLIAQDIPAHTHTHKQHTSHTIHNDSLTGLGLTPGLILKMLRGPRSYVCGRLFENV